MTASKSLSVVMFIRNMAVSYLDHALYTLSHQTIPPTEIVFVDCSDNASNAHSNRLIAEKYGLVRFHHVPTPTLNLSRSLNIALQLATSEYVMTSQVDLLYSKDVVACVLELLGETCVVQSPRGDIPIGLNIGPAELVHDGWQALLSALKPQRPTMLSPGTIIAMQRKWLLDVHGFDEILTPYNYCDVNLLFRAGRSGFTTTHLPWDKCQILHIGHATRGEYYSISSTYPAPSDPIVANGEKWGMKSV